MHWKGCTYDLDGFACALFPAINMPVRTTDSAFKQGFQNTQNVASILTMNKPYENHPCFY
jgi:hypothetical protein